jgi:hypothetical protein
MAKSKPRNTSKPQAQTPPPAAPSPAGTKPVRFRLTAPYKTETGVTWPSGYLIDATPDEIERRKIPAEPVA